MNFYKVERHAGTRIINLNFKVVNPGVEIVPRNLSLHRGNIEFEPLTSRMYFFAGF